MSIAATGLVLAPSLTYLTVFGKLGLESEESPMREHAHELLDRLDAARLAAVVHLLEAFLEEDGSTLSPTEAKAIAEADEWSKHNEPIPNEDVLAEFGLSRADWEKMSREP